MRFYRVAVLVLLAALIAAAGVYAQELERPPAFSNVQVWNYDLGPIFEEASAKYNVPLPLLLALGHFGSAFENRGDAPTIEGGYGVMALRQNSFGGNSLAEAVALTGVSEDQVKRDARSNIMGAAAVLDAYARQFQVNRNAGLDAWLDVVIKYAAIDKIDAENPEPIFSRLFAMEVFEKLQKGINTVNSMGEQFSADAQNIGTIDLASLQLPEMQNRPSAGYSGAIWYPAASCNYSAVSTNKSVFVVHTIEGTASGCLGWFRNCAAQTSAHYVCSEAGTVWQMVDEWYRAWHVGCANNYCIGCEHEGYASSPSHPTSLYNASAKLARDICNRWGIPKVHNPCQHSILGHKDVNVCWCGGDHWDPGAGWNWTYYIQQVQGGAPPPPTWAATYVNQSYPSTMTAGETAIAWVEYKNTGSGTWTHSATCLGTSSPQDRASPFYNSANWINNKRPSDVDQSSVTNGQTGRFTFILKAPTTPGTYTEKYKLVQSNSTWFGSEVTWTITVKAATGNITGTIRNSYNNDPLSGVTVAVTGGPTATTNASGVYTISGLAPGAKTLTVSKTAFTTQTASVTVTAGQTATKNFSLESTDKTAPTVPTNLTANAISPSQINLAWSASTDSGGAGLAGYIVYRGGSEIGRVTTTSYSDNGLNANTAYSYTVKAYDNAGNASGASNAASATTHIAAVPIFQDGFANLNYWQALVEGSMPGPNPAVLANDGTNHDHAQFAGVNSIKTVDSSNGMQGCLTGHTFDIPFGAAKFESWFFDGSGLGYVGQFERDTEGWAMMPDAWATFETVTGGTSGKCLKVTDGGWTGGARKEFTGGFAVGEAYTLKMSVKIANEGTWGTAPYAFVRCLNSSGGIIEEKKANLTLDNAWHTYTITGTIPSGTTKIWIGQYMYLNATKTYSYHVDAVSFVSSFDVKARSSRQGLQVRCVDPNTGSPKAIYFLGTYNASPGSLGSYSGGYYKVCGPGCTNWYWPLANCKERTPGWHKFTIDFTPYTGAKNEVKYYIDGTLVGSVERTEDTQNIGLNMVAYGFHYRVNSVGWFDDCAMYAAPPVAPVMGTPQTLSTTSIRWKVTDKSNNEVGFKVVNAAQAIVASAPVANGSGSVVNMDETDLVPNTAYTRTAKAFNGSLDSSPTGAATKWTLSVPPTKTNITCDRAEGSSSASQDVTFTAVGGFGSGTVARYLYAWDASPTHTWTGSEEVWDSGDLILKAPAAGNYYLHVKGYNGEGVENGTLNLGPYGYFNEPPTNPTSVTETHGAQTEIWQSTVSTPSFTWSGATADAGIAGYLVYFGTDPDGTSENLVTSAAYTADAVSTGTYYLRLRTKDNIGQTATKWMTAFEFKYDSTAPAAPEVTDDGDFTGSTSKLHAMWYATDEESDVVEYQYAVGTSEGASDVVDWTSAGDATQANISIPDPGLQPGVTYFISVKAKNGAGLWGEAGSSDGIALAPSVLSIGAAKLLPNATPVALSNKIVTASFMSSFYIEEENRASGILVLSDMPPARGSLVTVGGMMGENAIGERAILNGVVTVEAEADPLRIPGPLYTNCSALGGSTFGLYTAGRDGGVGLNNVGLLVKVCGRVESINEWDVEITDGSATISVFAGGVELPELAIGDFVSVVGISSLELDPTLKSIVRLVEENGITKLN
ncbi:MAG: N-acetylmuramoyl-L-alanine amidase [Armatimonadota bacterium]